MPAPSRDDLTDDLARARQELREFYAKAGASEQFLADMDLLEQYPDALREYHRQVAAAFALKQHPAAKWAADAIAARYRRTPEIETLVGVEEDETPALRARQYHILVDMAERAGARQALEALDVLCEDAFVRRFSRIPPVTPTCVFIDMLREREYA